MTATQQNTPELHVGSNVYTKNGEKVGRLRFMVVDPDSATVSHLVLEKGMMLASDALAPVESVGRVLHRGIFLNLTRADVSELPEFAEDQYLSRDGGGGDRGDRDNNRGGRRGKGRYRRHRGRDRDRD